MASNKKNQPKPKPVTVEAVLAALDSTEAFKIAKSYWVQKGVKPTETWGARETKEVVCNSLTAVEDCLEGKNSAAAKTTVGKVRDVRRRLEQLLWL